MVDDTTALYTAEEARDLAAHLDQSDQKSEQLGSERQAFVTFLQHGADRLERGEVSRNVHDEFRDWR